MGQAGHTTRIEGNLDNQSSLSSRRGIVTESNGCQYTTCIAKPITVLEVRVLLTFKESFLVRVRPLEPEPSTFVAAFLRELGLEFKASHICVDHHSWVQSALYILEC